MHFDVEFEPEILIGDAADPIRNAYYAAFDSALLDVLCYAQCASHTSYEIVENVFLHRNTAKHCYLMTSPKCSWHQIVQHSK